MWGRVSRKGSVVSRRLAGVRAVNALVPFLASAGLLLVAVLLYRNTSPHSARGGPSYEWCVRRRELATILFALAAICGLYGGVISLAALLNTPFFPAPVP